MIIISTRWLFLKGTGLTFEQSKVPERTAAVPLPCGCCAGSHWPCWSHCLCPPHQTSVRRSVVSEENLTTNIHHWERRGGTLGCRGGRHHWDWRVFSPAVSPSQPSAHSPRPLHFQVGTFSVERRPLDTVQPMGASCGRWATNRRPWPSWTLQSQWVLSPGQPTTAGGFDARGDFSSQSTSHDPY